jgi:hypothetical protein
MNSLPYFLEFPCRSFFHYSTSISSCSRGGTNPFAKDDGEVKENIENLMGLAVGMTKGQVFDLLVLQITWKDMIGEVFGFTKSEKVVNEGTLAIKI